MKKALLLVTLILSGCKSTFISYSYEVNSNKYNTEPAIEIYEVQSGEFTLFDLNYYVEINSKYDNYLLEKGEYLDNVYIDGCFKNYYNVYRYNKGQEKLLVELENNKYYLAHVSLDKNFNNIEEIFTKIYNYSEEKEDYIKSIYYDESLINVDYTLFLEGIFESNVDNDGFDDLMRDIYEMSKDEIISGENFTGGYIGGVENRYPIKIVTNEDLEINLTYIKARLIDNPKYFSFYNNHYKISDKLLNVYEFN